MRTRNRLLIFIPLLIVLLIVSVLVALPSFVSSRAHRATIEALASSLTGRDVHIGGHLSLALFPTPQLIAEQITINGPADETITARSLVLDIAVPALLQGRLSARDLVLQSPTITIPWPLPEGAAALSPPSWLTALHGQIANGRITIGALSFSHVSADLFTGANGALSIAGSFTYGQAPLILSLSLGVKTSAGQMPVTFDASTNDAKKLSAHFSGTLDSGGGILGTLNATGNFPGFPQTANATAAIKADRNMISAANLAISQGGTAITGAAQLDFPTATLTATLNSQNLDLSSFAGMFTPGFNPPVLLNLNLNAANSNIDGVKIPQIQALANFGQGGFNLPALVVSLPGNSSLISQLTVSPAGMLAGKVRLATNNLPALLTVYGTANSLPGDWAKADFTATLQGDHHQLIFHQLLGSIGPSQLTGGVIFIRAASGISATGQLHFNQLNLTPLPALFQGITNFKNFHAEGEITADKAIFYNLPMTHLLLDAGLGPRFSIRRVSASLYNGLAAASFTVDGNQITTARALLSVPSAQKLAGLLPASWQLPAVLLQKPLAISVLAEGPQNALATSAVAALGDISITAAPIVNLTQRAAAGPFTLRYPNAIAAAAAFGDHAGLDWPGAGSVSLRADLAISPSQLALPDFVLSFGDLSANGKIIYTGDKINADIDADTLALPKLTSNSAIPLQLLANITGTINLNANRVLAGGQSILGPSSASLTLAPNLVKLTVPHITLANGALAGSITAVTSATAIPQLTAQFKIANIDVAGINLPWDFPYTLSSGLLAGQAGLNASGATPAGWGATLGGAATLTAAQGSLNGFNLAGLAAALKSPQRGIALRKAALSGGSRFSSFTLTGNFNHGNFALGSASLLGQDGNATAAGSINLPNNIAGLKISLLPKVTPPLTIGLTTTGRWSSPKQVPDLKPALSWKQAP